MLGSPSLVAQTVKNLPAMQKTPIRLLDRKIPWRSSHSSILGLPLVAQTVKNLPAMWETWVQSLGWEDPLEEGMATHFSILARRIPMDRGAWKAAVHGVTKSWT